MAKTISELRNQSIQVRDASAAGENTATRVGTVLNDIVGHIEDYENTQSSNNSSQDAKIEGVKSSLNAEISRAKTEESNLSTQIGTERTERQAAVSREETARIQADNDEKTARQQADNAEQDARIKADNDEKTARENADITLRTMIQTEVSNRQIAVKQEEIRAMAAELANTQAIEDENARAKTAEQANAQAIADETTRATAEEERLQGEIDNTNTNVGTLENKVNSNHDHLTDEVARLDLTDNEIKAGLEAEIARAEAAEQAIIFDVSAYNNGAFFESISALLGNSNLDTLIPVSFRHGGMTIRFIKGSEQSSDNKYVQFRLMSNVWSTTVAEWQGVDDEPTAGSVNLVKSGGVYDKLADLEGKVGTFDKNVQVEDNPEYKDISIGADGKIYRAMTHEDEIRHYVKHVFEAGIESKELKDLLEKITEKLSIEEYNKTIANLDNEEFVHVIVDSMGRILKSFDKYGKETNYLDTSFLKGLHINKAEINNIDTPEYLYVILDSEGRILFSIDANGKIGPTKDEEPKEEPKNETRNIEALKIIANMPVPCSVDESGKEIVSNVSLRNLQRRANRFANIEWNALHPIASTSSHTGISAGNHRGIPYTSCMEVDRFVGFNVSILTFMTAANNPYSLLYTEDLRRNMSGYGFTYHGDRATIGGWMGIVCNIFVEYSIGMKIPFDTGSWEYLVNQGIIAPVYDVSAEGVRVGDMLWEPGHGRLVTNIWRNADGSVNNVEVMESVQDFPVKTLFTATNFDNYLANHNGKIYRYLYLYENINDSATPFEEGGDGYVYNDDVCTFAGDYASFREGYPIFINYNLKENKEWDVIEIYKDGQKVAEEVLDLSQHRIDISSMSSTYGKYKARLRLDTAYSDYTYWEVISADVECSKDDDGLNIVTFGSKNGNPMYVTFHKINGGPKATYAFSSDELNKGRCKFSIRQLIEAQYNNLNADSTYCKVIFEGEYGRITSEPILIDNII